MTENEYKEMLLSNFAANFNNQPSEWVISERLSGKITADGGLNDFYGATTVIHLSDEAKSLCRNLQTQLFEHNPDMFVALDPDTFHLTIHALCNVYSVSPDIDEITTALDNQEPMVRAEFKQIAEAYPNTSIQMKALGTSTNGKDVVSIKFVPASGDDFNVLMDLFQRIENIHPLGERFIPHVSLGYFKLKHYTADEINRLYTCLVRLNEQSDFEIKLDVRQLVYQIHTNMNHFTDRFGVGDFL
jgi:2'-5' RNA ligase